MQRKEKENILREVYKYLKIKGYKEFKSSFLELEQPNTFVEKQTGNNFEPDLVATYRSGSYIFVVETVESIIKRRENFILKCKTFLQYVSSKNGKFTLIVPEQQFDQVLTEMNKSNLENVGLMQVSYS